MVLLNLEIQEMLGNLFKNGIKHFWEEEESLYNIEEEGEIILKVLIIIKEIINLEEIEEASDQEEEDIKKGINE